MSDHEGFLARWSRKKRSTDSAPRDPAESTTRGETAPDPATPESPAPALLSEEAQPSLDPALLLPVDSIGPESEIGAFLAPGVPPALARAALRRAWSADPAIRDFIGLSENSGDFNLPGGMHGFGSVTAEQVRRLLARATGAPEDPSRSTQAASGDRDPAATERDSVAPKADQEQTKKHDDSGRDQQDLVSCNKADAATQHESAPRMDDKAPASQKRHGGALPE